MVACRSSNSVSSTGAEAILGESEYGLAHPHVPPVWVPLKKEFDQNIWKPFQTMPMLKQAGRGF